MLWLRDYTDKIREHLKIGDAKSLTYAALEARLALEHVCYDRLRIAHKYISNDDLRTWRPHYVVRAVMEMVDTNIASEWTLSIGSVHGDNPTEYLKLGTQKGFDPKYVSQLWQAMSSFLHCELPKNATSAIEHYKAENKLRPKIEEVLNELDRLAEGTVVASMVFQQVSFDCVCGQRNSRSTAVLKLNDIFNCIKEGCKEQYRVEKMGEEFLFERHLIPVSCYNCGDANGLPYRQVCELDKGSEGWKFDCRKCGKENVFMWKLKQFKRNDKDDASLL